MGLDQSQEHSLKLLKEDHGCKGRYGQVEEKAVIEFSKADFIVPLRSLNMRTSKSQSDSTEHPDRSVSEQQRFRNQLEYLLDLVHQQITTNPYRDTDDQLETLDTGE